MRVLVTFRINQPYAPRSTFDPRNLFIHSSHSWLSAVGESGVAPLDRDFATLCFQSPQTDESRSSPLGVVMQSVDGLEIGALPRQAGDSPHVAPESLSNLLDMEKPEPSGWPPPVSKEIRQLIRRKCCNKREWDGSEPLVFYEL